jgi:hypothetical protein
MAQFFNIQDIGAIGPELYLAMFGMIVLVLDLVVEKKRTLGLVALIGLSFSGLFLMRLRGVEVSAFLGNSALRHVPSLRSLRLHAIHPDRSSTRRSAAGGSHFDDGDDHAFRRPVFQNCRGSVSSMDAGCI